MTYHEYSTYMKVCDYLGKEPQGDFLKMNTFLNKVCDSMEITTYEENNRKYVVIYTEGKPFFIFDTVSGWLRIVPGDWEIIESVESFISNGSARVFITDFIEDHLKGVFQFSIWEMDGKMVEKLRNRQ
jgi:hypothetical protein